MKINLINKETGAIKECSIGYSWATAICGPLTPLVRGDSLSFCFLLAVNMLLFMLKAGFFVTLLPSIIYANYINGMFIRNRVTRKGYTYADETAREYLAEKGLLLEN